MMNDPKILIVEDENDVAIDLKDKFRYWGYSTPIVVSSQKEALEITNKLKPDIVLVDTKLKNDDSIKLVKKITDNYDTAVIYMGDYFNEEMMHLMRSTRPYGYISIPFEENQLKYNIEDAIYRKRLHQRFISSK